MKVSFKVSGVGMLEQPLQIEFVNNGECVGRATSKQGDEMFRPADVPWIRALVCGWGLPTEFSHAARLVAARVGKQHRASALAAACNERTHYHNANVVDVTKALPKTRPRPLGRLRPALEPVSLALYDSTPLMLSNDQGSNT